MTTEEIPVDVGITFCDGGEGRYQINTLNQCEFFINILNPKMPMMEKTRGITFSEMSKTTFDEFYSFLNLSLSEMGEFFTYKPFEKVCAIIRLLDRFHFHHSLQANITSFKLDGLWKIVRTRMCNCVNFSFFLYEEQTDWYTAVWELSYSNIWETGVLEILTFDCLLLFYGVAKTHFTKNGSWLRVIDTWLKYHHEEMISSAGWLEALKVHVEEIKSELGEEDTSDYLRTSPISSFKVLFPILKPLYKNQAVDVLKEWISRHTYFIKELLPLMRELFKNDRQETVPDKDQSFRLVALHDIVTGLSLTNLVEFVKFFGSISSEEIVNWTRNNPSGGEEDIHKLIVAENPRIIKCPFDGFLFGEAVRISPTLARLYFDNIYFPTPDYEHYVQPYPNAFAPRADLDSPNITFTPFEDGSGVRQSHLRLGVLPSSPLFTIRNLHTHGIYNRASTPDSDSGREDKSTARRIKFRFIEEQPTIFDSLTAKIEFHISSWFDGETVNKISMYDDGIVLNPVVGRFNRAVFRDTVTGLTIPHEMMQYREKVIRVRSVSFIVSVIAFPPSKGCPRFALSKKMVEAWAEMNLTFEEIVKVTALNDGACII